MFKMANKPTFLKPDIDFSDDEEDPLATKPSSKRISNQIKKTQTNKNAIKNPNTSNIDVDEDAENNDDDEVIISEDDSPKKSNQRASKRKPAKSMSNSKTTKKKKKASDSDDEFLGEDSDESNDSDDEESIASEDLSEENISDSDFNPESEEEIEAEKEDTEYFDEQDGNGEATINLSSDGDSPDKKDSTKTFDPNSREFWDKVQELRSKGFSIQQAGNGGNTKSKF